MDFLPTIVLLLFVVVGYVATFRELGKRLPNDMRSRASVLGGYATGLLGLWGLASFVRFLFLLPRVQTFSFPGILLAPLSVFYVESFFLLAFLGYEFWFLRGSYSGATEWKNSCKDGINVSLKLVVMTSCLFLVTWWMICPQEYGSFRGSYVNGFVGGAGIHAFESSAPVTATNAAAIARLENGKAISHAASIAPILLCLVFLAKYLFIYMRGVLDDDYLHVAAEQKQTSRSRKFRIRGGSPN